MPVVLSILYFVLSFIVVTIISKYIGLDISNAKHGALYSLISICVYSVIYLLFMKRINNIAHKSFFYTCLSILFSIFISSLILIVQIGSGEAKIRMHDLFTLMSPLVLILIITFIQMRNNKSKTLLFDKGLYVYMIVSCVVVGFPHYITLKNVAEYFFEDNIEIILENFEQYKLLKEKRPNNYELMISKIKSVYRQEGVSERMKDIIMDEYDSLLSEAITYISEKDINILLNIRRDIFSEFLKNNPKLCMAGYIKLPNTLSPEEKLYFNSVYSRLEFEKMRIVREYLQPKKNKNTSPTVNVFDFVTKSLLQNYSESDISKFIGSLKNNNFNLIEGDLFCKMNISILDNLMSLDSTGSSLEYKKAYINESPM